MKKIFLIAPFISFFFTTVFLFEYFHREKKTILINFIGKTVNEIIPWITDNEIKIIFEEYIIDNNRQEGLIVDQSPSENSEIFSNSKVYLKVIVKKIDNLENLTGEKIEEIESILNLKGIIYKKIYIPCNYPKNLIYAFSFDKNKNFAKIYVSKGNLEKHIFKDLKKNNCKKIKDENKNLQFICLNENNEIITEDHDLEIKSTNPNRGSIINLENKSFKIYLWH